MDEIKKKRGLHPVWFFLLLIIITVLLSFLLSLLGLQGTEYSVSQSGKITTTILYIRNILLNSIKEIGEMKKLSKTQVTDILLLGFISGVVAILTSFMGISGTIIGAVVTSIIAETLKTYFKEPIKDKINEYEKENQNIPRTNRYPDEYRTDTYSSMPRPKRYENNSYKSDDDSFLTAKILFIFPLVIILIIELIHFLGAIHLIPYDIFYSLESITNWKLLRTIGYALIIMGIYPIISKKFSTHNGIILIIVGLIELMFGYADVSNNALMLTSMISSLKEFINIGIILAILYTILTIHEESNLKHLPNYFFY